MKKTFVVDCCLLGAFVLSALSGIGLHVAGHRDGTNLWQHWTVVHTLASSLFVIAVALHILMHLNWYKELISKGIGKRSKITVVLSITFLFVSGTGIVLLCGTGINAHIGLLHYKIGMVTIIISIGHILKRLPILHKYRQCVKSI